MNRLPTHSLKTKFLAINRKLHRFMALVAAVSLIFFVITGMILNHSDQWGLSQSYIQHPALLKQYGLQARSDRPLYGYSLAKQGDSAPQHWVSHVEQSVFFNTHRVGDCDGLLGVIDSETLWVLVCTQAIFIVNDQGEWLEPPMSVDFDSDASFGFTQGNRPTLVETGRLWLWQADAYEFQLVAQNKPTDFQSASDPIEVPHSLATTLQQTRIEHEITVERFMLDLHAGRWLGAFRIVLVDIVGLMLLLVAFSGLVLWFQSPKRRRDK